MLISSILLSVYAQLHFSNANDVVKTEYGFVRGVKGFTTALNKTYQAFRGIPYAKPPLGELRFNPPIPPNSWNNTLGTYNDRDMCTQGELNVTGSEDCLYLNVYTPNVEAPQKYAVMVYIHGGGFTLDNPLYTSYGPDYFLDLDVIVVTINYRLGIFGFISTNDLVAPGNIGLKDQLFALKWVQRNIEHFGGDPGKVTIFGQSAGAASVSYHIVSKKSKGVFQRAITQSGSSIAVWALSRYARKLAFDLGRKLLINTSTSKTLIDGLKKVDYKILQTTSQLINYAIVLRYGLQNGLVLAPVKEPEHKDAFFTEKSHELLRTGDFNRVPVIIGYTSGETSTRTAPIFSLYTLRYDLDNSNLVPIDMNINNRSLKQKVGSIIKNHYYGSAPVIFSSENTDRFLSDDLFIRPAHESVRLQSKYAKVYCYRFSYEGQLGGVDHNRIKGVNHAEDLYYFWRKNNASASAATEADRRAREKAVKLWVNFAKFGEPTPIEDNLFGNVKWAQAQYNENVTCLDIGEKLEIVSSPNKEGVDFYRNLYNRYGVPPFDTY